MFIQFEKPQFTGLFGAATRLAVLLLVSCSWACAYSVLTHEAIVDSLWNEPIQKMLLKRFPAASPVELNEAHAYAYGGCIIQDMGYYPFSSKLFSDLTHYVRSGDFVMALLDDSQDVNEYAFALGALAHYAADVSGHGLGVNPAVPLLYPELRKRFGAIVTYDDNPLSHIRTEFGFDVLQVAQGRYASDQYRAFIGFKVSKPVLERAVMDTYGLEMKDLFGSLDLALGTFRYTTSSVIPQMTKLAWELRSQTILKETPGITKRKFLFNLSKSSYQKDWGSQYRHPGIRGRVLSALLRIMPKSGPFKGLAFQAPTPEVEVMFMKSFNATIDQYRGMLANESTDKLDLQNRNFDTGRLVEAGRYMGADLAYDQLLAKLSGKQFAGLTNSLRANILTYYEARQAPVDTDAKHTVDWKKTLVELDQLRLVQPDVIAAR